MAIEHTPASPVAQDYQPARSVPYRVKDGDDWYSVARLAGVSAKDLIAFNFKTTVPAEVNWYLRRNVGCCRETWDRKNWMFTSSASPGIIYLPRCDDGPVGDGEYVVQEGESVNNIAYDHGHMMSTVWEDDGNTEVRRVRMEPRHVQPEDRLHIPEVRKKQIAAGTENKHVFRRLGKRVAYGVLEIVTDMSPAELQDRAEKFALKGNGPTDLYDKELAASDLAILRDGTVLLRFTGLPTDARYSLTITDDAESYPLFSDVEYRHLHELSTELRPSAKQPA
jgi:hypothetical protein